MINNYHLLEAQQFDRSKLDEIFEASDLFKIRTGPYEFRSYVAKGKIMASLFYEPSTRTRFSFEAAMHRLGGAVISTENATDFSSVTKGENLEDTIRTVSSYVDCIVLRHSEEGSSQLAAEVSSVPIINAGDGEGQHPTQSLIDLYTIKQECGTIDGLIIGLVGDLLKGRTTHSLAYLLAKYDIEKLYLAAPKIWQMKPEILEYLDRHDVNYELVDNLEDILPVLDVMYSTRIQKERWETYTQMYEVNQAFDKFILNEERLSKMKDTARILHPFPRLSEITKGVDNDPRAAYFRQIKNGLFVRMAILAMVLPEDDF